MTALDRIRNLWNFGQLDYLRTPIQSEPVAEWRFYLKAWLDDLTGKRKRLLSSNFIRCLQREAWMQRFIRHEARWIFCRAVFVGALAGLWLALGFAR